MAGGRVRSFVRGRRQTLTPHEGRSCHVVCMVKRPRDSYIVTSLVSLDVATPENNSIHWTLSSICKKICLTSGS